MVIDPMGPGRLRGEVVIHFEDSGVGSGPTAPTVAGTVTVAGDGEPSRRFEGWVELLGMLQALRVERAE